MEASKPVYNLFSHSKNRLMHTRQILNRLIILSFMVLVGFSIAKAIYTGSIIGVLLSFISLGAAVYFLYTLAKAKEEFERSDTA
jgi:putative effector of murein hydrolase LrgA (UPF0299 family)